MNGQDLSPEEFYALLHPDKPFGQRHLNNLLSGLNRLLLQFVSISSFLEQPHLHRAFTLRGINRKGADKYFDSFQRRSLEKLTRDPSSPETFLEGFMIEEEFNQFFLRGAYRKEPNQRLADLHLALDHHYLTQKLRFACIALIQERITNFRIDLTSLSHLLPYLEEQGNDLPLLTQLYYQAYLATADPDNESHFLKLLSLLLQPGSIAQIDREHLQQLFRIALSYCINQLNLPNVSFREHAISLYQYGLESGLLLEEDGKMSRYVYKNIVVVMSRASAFDWVESFLENGLVHLEPEEREAATFYNRAVLFHYQKAYRDSNQFLRKVLEGERDPFYALDGRTYLCRNLYYLEDQDQLEREFRNFSRFLRNRDRKISNEHLRHYDSRMKAFKELFGILYGPPDEVKQRLSELRGRVLSEGFSPTEWLVKEIDKMIAER